MDHNLEGMVIPKHVALILDGNGRWAKKRGLPRGMGHKEDPYDKLIYCSMPWILLWGCLRKPGMC